MADVHAAGRPAAGRQHIRFWVLLITAALGTALCGRAPATAVPAAGSGDAQMCAATTGPSQWQVEHLLGLHRDGQMSHRDCLAIQEAQKRLGITPADGAADQRTFQMLLAAGQQAVRRPSAAKPAPKPVPKPAPKPKPKLKPKRPCAECGQAAARRWMPPLKGRHRISARYHIPGAWLAGYHTGIDLAVPSGTPVHAVGSGTVLVAGWTSRYYGNAVTLRLVDGRYVVYAHLSRVSVRPGAQVRAGTRVGYSGNTGRSSGPHLHFEVRNMRHYGSDTDPVRYLAQHGVRPRWSTAVPRAGQSFTCDPAAASMRQMSTQSRSTVRARHRLRVSRT